MAVSVRVGIDVVGIVDAGEEFDVRGGISVPSELLMTIVFRMSTAVKIPSNSTAKSISIYNRLFVTINLYILSDFTA